MREKSRIFELLLLTFFGEYDIIINRMIVHYYISSPHMTALQCGQFFSSRYAAAHHVTEPAER